MSEMTQVEVDEATSLAAEIAENPYRHKGGRGWSSDEILLARAVLHLAEQDRRNRDIRELLQLAVKDAEERLTEEVQAMLARQARRNLRPL